MIFTFRLFSPFAYGLCTNNKTTLFIFTSSLAAQLQQPHTAVDCVFLLNAQVTTTNMLNKNAYVSFT